MNVEVVTKLFAYFIETFREHSTRWIGEIALIVIKCSQLLKSVPYCWIEDSCPSDRNAFKSDYSDIYADVQNPLLPSTASQCSLDRGRPSVS